MAARTACPSIHDRVWSRLTRPAPRRARAPGFAWLAVLALPALLLPVHGLASARSDAEERRALDVAATDLERRMTRCGCGYPHPELNAYLQAVAEKLLATDASPAPGPIRVMAFKNPVANAFALPNGAIFITTALLQRLENEAQLASVLGHELQHFTGAHALLEARQERSAGLWSRSLALLVAVTATVIVRDPQFAQFAAQVSRDTGDLWTLASVSGYSRDREREADREGMRRLAAAGYDASAGVAAFEALQGAARDEGTAAATPYFASHPRLSERIASYRELVSVDLAGATGPERRLGREEYAAHTRGLDLDQVEILIAAREVEQAGKILRPALERNDGARGRYLEGELARRSGHTAESDTVALAAYEKAQSMASPPADAFRQAALIHRVRGEHDDARRAFQRYIELAPEAVDVPIVRAYLAAAKAPATEPAASEPRP